jgi:hypothetical protein
MGATGPGSRRLFMSSSNRPYVFICLQNSGDRPLRSASVSVGPFRIGQDPLHQQGVHVGQGGLEQMQGEHADLLALLVRAGQVAVLAVEEGLVGRVPVLDHLQALADLLAHLGVGQVVVDERRPHRPGQQVLQPVRASLPEGLGQRPAVADAHLRQQPCDHLRRRGTGLTPGEAVRDRIHRRPGQPAPRSPRSRVRGHLTLIRRHKR